MKTKNLGKSTTQVPVIGQGSMGIGGYLKQDSGRDDEQVRNLRLGIELGMTLIDTAEGYGEGHSEELVARAIRGIRDRVFIATKFAPEHSHHDDVLKSAEASLRRLQTDHIDLYQTHWRNPRIPAAETLGAMERLVSEGKVRHIGLSNASSKELREAQTALSRNAIASVQVEYNLFDRSIESSFLPFCEKEKITTIAYSPLDQGHVGAGHPGLAALERIAGKHNRTVAQVALNWLVAHPSVIAIPKAASPEHLRENASAADFELSREDLDAISDAFARQRVSVPVDRIRVITGGQGNRLAYHTLEEALKNELGFTPSPLELAADISDGEDFKPVRVVKSADGTGKYDYDLVEGRIRYWAWVIAHKGEKPVPVLVRGK